MPDTFIKIATVTVGAGGAASIDFTSIPSTYTDLVLKISARTSRASLVDAISLSLNGLATNQTSRYLEGDGASATSNSLTSFRTLATGNTATANTFSNSEFYIPNYAGSTFKSASSDGVTENNATNAYAWLVANLWSATAAINQITVTDLNSATFLQYTTATLYGISKT
jgi:hypothetical protein